MGNLPTLLEIWGITDENCMFVAQFCQPDMGNLPVSHRGGNLSAAARDRMTLLWDISSITIDQPHV